MVKQGDIVWLEFDPQTGHEQAGRRPAVIIGNNFFNKITGMAIVCPITNTRKTFPLHISLDIRTKTTGMIECEHIKSLDILVRKYRYTERLPDDLLYAVTEAITAEISLIKNIH